jgi:hypothetical protein
MEEPAAQVSSRRPRSLGLWARDDRLGGSSTSTASPPNGRVLPPATNAPVRRYPPAPQQRPARRPDTAARRRRRETTRPARPTTTRARRSPTARDPVCAPHADGGLLLVLTRGYQRSILCSALDAVRRHERRDLAGGAMAKGSEVCGEGACPRRGSRSALVQKPSGPVREVGPPSTICLSASAPGPIAALLAWGARRSWCSQRAERLELDGRA